MTQYGFIFVEKYITAPSMSCFVSVLLSAWMCVVCTLCRVLGRSPPGVTDILRPSVACGGGGMYALIVKQLFSG